MPLIKVNICLFQKSRISRLCVLPELYLLYTYDFSPKNSENDSNISTEISRSELKCKIGIKCEILHYGHNIIFDCGTPRRIFALPLISYVSNIIMYNNNNKLTPAIKLLQRILLVI
uniref:Uncharacterized protein n=1 Tax=Cacopsylla melanoneura TaxID=428564 RepID=A0A8D8XHI4_9HEMI